MSKGLYKTLYSDQGSFKELYSERGSPVKVHRMDIRLGQYGEDDEDENSPSSPPLPNPEESKKDKDSIFSKDFLGIPIWLISILFLGFAYSRRKQKKLEQS